MLKLNKYKFKKKLGTDPPTQSSSRIDFSRDC